MTVYPSLSFAKLSTMKSGDIFDTLGQFHPDGFGAARYLVKTVQEWRDDPFIGLPNDWEPEQFRREEASLANGLVARLICDFSPEHQKATAQGYNLIGDVKYGGGTTVRFLDERDIVKQADGGYDQYHTLANLPQSVSGGYTNDLHNDPDTGRIYLDKERGTWQNPDRKSTRLNSSH